MTDFKQNDFGQTESVSPKYHKDILVGSFCHLEYKPLQNYYKPNNFFDKNNNGAKKSFDDFNRAKERIKQQIISSDKTQDNSLLYTAISQFKKNNE